MSDRIFPFIIETNKDEIEDLKRRIHSTRFPEAETVSDWSQGIPLTYVQDLAEYWANDYDWWATQERLNALPQFVTKLDGIDIHFVHVRSADANAIPLLLTHGWPGSFVEFLDVIEPLTKRSSVGGLSEIAFHVVCPSLPGFGFSGKPVKTGWNVQKIAAHWDELMHRLGYDGYVAQGGDWGAFVTSAIASQNEGRCQGIHLNMPLVTPDPDTMDDLTDAEQSILADMKFINDWGVGYAKQQSTRPQTLGYGLTDSPVGQMAWIIEKFHEWADCNGHPENAITRDRLLDNVMLYWLPAVAASSARLYWESLRDPFDNDIFLPSAISVFPKDIMRTSERWARKKYKDLRYFNIAQKGGHFAAMEQPELFANELRLAVPKIVGSLP